MTGRYSLITFERTRGKFCAFLFLTALLMSAACSRRMEVSGSIDEIPAMFPDYAGVCVPSNIAPLNFSYLGDEPSALVVRGKGEPVRIAARSGLFSFRKSVWRRMMKENAGDSICLSVQIEREGKWLEYRPFSIAVSSDEIDPWLSYRLIPPGYQAWKRVGIYQRNLETYSQTAVFENKLTGGNCVNCHTYCQRDPSKMLFHARAEFGGTVMILDDKVEKLNTKTDSTVSALVYPYWHPSGKYVAFSVNKTNQNFFSHNPDRVEVYDSASDVVVYDVEGHSISWSPLTRSEASFETFPTFSPDGEWLYFCSAEAVAPLPEKYDKVKYSLCRVGFNPSDATFGDKVDTLFSGPANGKSVSFPRISPDGSHLVFTVHEYGNFSIWHKDSDLWVMDIPSGEARPLAAANSDDVDSYHSWSGNSRWLVFASRRLDGLHSRPYICHIDEDGNSGKPFLLPQKNPAEYYAAQMNSFNIPELMSRRVTVNPHDIAAALRGTPGTDVKVR